MASWGDIFDDDGDEEGNWDRLPSYHDFQISALVEKATERHVYGPTTAYFFAINYVLGVGCLGVPRAIYCAGLVLGPLIMVFTTAVSYVTVMWVAETVARAEMLAKLPCECGSKRWLCIRVHGPIDRDDPHVPWREADHLVQPTKDRYAAHVSGFDGAHVHVQGEAPEKSYEVLEMTYKFMGRKGKASYQLSLMLLMYSGLLAYSQVFLSTIKSVLPEHLVPSYVPGLVFAAMVVPLSCLDLTEQVHLQILLSLLRFLSLAIMIIASVVGMYIDPLDTPQGPDTKASPPYLTPPALVDFSGFGLVFSVALFAQLFQHSVPNLIQPLQPQDRPKAKKVFLWALLTTLALYLVLGITTSLYFGSDLLPAVNLNFASFTWGYRNAPPPLTFRLLSLLVVLFPALDVISVFPLISNTLGNNLAVAFPELRRLLKKHLISIDRKSWILGWRLVACIPPLIISFLSADLSTTLQWAGLFGLVVAFIVPARLQLKSTRSCDRCFGSHTTIHSSGYYSRIELTWLVQGFSLFALAVLLYELFKS